MQYGGGAPLLELLPLDKQIHLRKARSVGWSKHNVKKWKNTTKKERQEIVKSTLHTKKANKKRSSTIKKEWESYTIEERDNKLKGLKNWRNNLTQQEITEKAMKNLPDTTKKWKIIDPDGNTYITNGIGDLINKTGINLYYAARKKHHIKVGQ